MRNSFGVKLTLLGGVALGALLATAPVVKAQSADVTVAPVAQTSTNMGDVLTNFGLVSVGAVLGDGASVQISATGAVASVSLSHNNALATVYGFAAVSQEATNYGSVLVNDGTGAAVNSTGAIAGAGSQVSISGTGAVAGFSLQNIASAVASLNAGNVTQTAQNFGSAVQVFGTISTGEISGTGAGVSIGGTGAVTSVSLSSIQGNVGADLAASFGIITQTSLNNAAVVTEASSITAGAVSGPGASVATSATGAVASVSVSRINDAASRATVVSTGKISQSSSNTGDVTSYSPAFQVGALTGNGTAVSVNASGAVASISSASIIDTGRPAGAITVQNVAQAADNAGAVTSVNNGITTGAVRGAGSTVSINASGAVSSISLTSIGGAPSNGAINRVVQGANNTGLIQSSGSITAGNLAGRGASIGISAAGATSALSLSNIR